VGLFIEAVGINPTGVPLRRISLEYPLSGSMRLADYGGNSGLVVGAPTFMTPDGKTAGNLSDGRNTGSSAGGTIVERRKFYLNGQMVGALIVQTLTTTIYASRSTEFHKWLRLCRMISLLQSGNPLYGSRNLGKRECRA